MNHSLVLLMMDDSINHLETMDIRYITYYKQLIIDILREGNAENFEQSIRFLKHIMIKIHHFQQLCRSDTTGKSYTEMIREVEDSYSLSETMENEKQIPYNDLWTFTCVLNKE